MRKENEKKYIRAIELKKQGVSRKDTAEELQVDVRTITIWTKHIPRVIKRRSRKKRLEMRREWYKNNCEIVKEGVKKRSKKMGEWWKNFKSFLFCKDCLENHISCLVFHHRNPEEKELNLGEVVGHGWSKKRILKEVDKCDVYCANCHRKLHWKERNVPIV